MASPAQMERELEQVCEEYGLEFSSLMNMEHEYKLLRPSAPRATLRSGGWRPLPGAGITITSPDRGRPGTT